MREEGAGEEGHAAPGKHLKSVSEKSNFVPFHCVSMVTSYFFEEYGSFFADCNSETYSSSQKKGAYVPILPISP